MNRDTSLPENVRILIGEFFEAPLKLDRTGVPHDIERSSLRRSEALAVASLVRDLRPLRSLEIGLAEGGSCIAIAATRRECGISNPHVALDPFQETLTGGAGLLEVERLGLRDAVVWQPVRSESYLHELWKAGETELDFAFVDGGHDIGQKVTDTFYLDKVLKPGGVIALHDGLLMSTAMSVRFLVQERGYTIIELPADDVLHRIIRSARYVASLGWWYATQVIPNMCRSLVALKKSSDDYRIGLPAADAPGVSVVTPRTQ